jgi:hypothetical protein
MKNATSDSVIATKLTIIMAFLMLLTMLDHPFSIMVDHTDRFGKPFASLMSTKRLHCFQKKIESC